MNVSYGSYSIAEGKIVNASQDVVVTPFSAFPDNSQVTVSVSGVQDSAGNTVVPFTSSFTTGTGALISGNVTGASPVRGAKGVPLNAFITIETDDPVDLLSVNNPGGGYIGSATGLYLYSVIPYTGYTLTGKTSVSRDGKTITFVPDALLSPSATYSFSAPYLRDIGGSQIIDTKGFSDGTFTTSGSSVTSPPAVVALDPPDQFTNVPIDIVPQVLFSEPLNISTIGAISLSSGGVTLNTTNAPVNGNQTVSLIPPGLLQPSTFYTITVGAVGDVAGNITVSPVSFHFTTGTGASLANPDVVSFLPASGSTGAAVSSTVSALFSAPLNPLTVKASAFQITDPSAAVVAGSLALSADGLTVTFTPAAALMPNATYTITVASITDQAGNTVAGTSGVFTTGSQ